MPSQKLLFDSHCHINDERFDDCRDLLIREFENGSLLYCTEIGCDLKTSLEAAALADASPLFFAACGYHPSETGFLEDDPSLLDRTLALFTERDRVKAIGEIGLDYHYDDGPSREIQQYWFRRQLDKAIELKAPVCIHSRDAEQDTMNILKESGIFSPERKSAFPSRPDGSGDARVLIHCFSGSAETARQYVSLGASVSLGGPVTFKNARKPALVAQSIPLWALLIETDSPYMAPEPMRGKANKPSYVEYVARKIAEIKGISYEEAARVTTENACRFYGIEE